MTATTYQAAIARPFKQCALAGIVLALSLSGCTQQSGAQAVPEVPGPAGTLLATVNGNPITEFDVRMKLQIKDPEKEIRPESMQTALDELIMEELKYRKALSLGLDKDQAYKAKIAEVMASVNYLKREEMGKLFQKDQVVEKAAVSDDEARKFFDENKQMIQTELNVWQILSKDSNEMEKLLGKIRSGTSFLEVAKARFPKLPKNVNAPWDLGYLHWNQIPETWHDEISKLKKGEVSGLIKGAGDRVWIVQLNDSRMNPEIDFESQKATIKLYLGERKKKALAKTTLEELRKNAKIVYPGK